MSKEIISKYEELSEYVCQNKYKSSFTTSVECKLFDYSIILAWKTFMFFIYEKFHQISNLDSNDAISNMWKDWKNKELRTFSPSNIYWANEEKDDEIIDFLKQIYHIDSNVYKQLKTLKLKRDRASHVSQLEFKEEDFSSYLREILLFIPQLQKIHSDNYLCRVCEKVAPYNEIAKYRSSSKDVDCCIEKLIDNLKNASSFKEAADIESKIGTFFSVLKEKYVIQILRGVFETKPVYNKNQILDGWKRHTSDFLNSLHRAQKIDIKHWIDFSIKIKKYNSDKEMEEYYSWLPTNKEVLTTC